MKTKYLIIFILCCFFLSCKKEEQLKFPVLITSSYDSIIQVNSLEMLESQPIVYGVNVKDTLDFSSRINCFENGYFGEIDYTQINRNDSVSIFVDSNYIDFHTDEMNGFAVFPFPQLKVIDSTYNEEYDYYENVYDSIAYEKWYVKLKNKTEKRKKTHYKTLPVYIFNNSNSNRVITKPIVNGNLFLITQAKDKKGDWKPIEYNDVPGFVCGTGHRDYSLKSKHFIVSSIKKYSGDFKTKIRVKFMSNQKIYYSNEFEAQINYSQFENSKEVESLYKKYSDSTNTRNNFKKSLIFLDLE